MKSTKKRLFLSVMLIAIGIQAMGQHKKKINLKDSLDRRLDLSDWIIDANGFVPVPIIITEPALGGFGIGLAPVFLKKRKPLITEGKSTPLPPDITAAAAAYTLNKTWFVGGGRSASIPKYRLRYKIGAAYANVNLSFYRTISNQGEKEFLFNGKVIPVYGYLAKQFHNPAWLIGIQYLFVNVKLKMANGDSVPDFVKDKEINSNISEIGIVGEYDKRDNIFTPDHGIKIHAHLNFSEEFLGSDYDYQRLNSYMYWYLRLMNKPQTGKHWISGLRFDYQQMFGDAPFYLLPYISMRGIPAVRYQGKVNLLVETEQRWDFVRRWSLLGFGGLGKAFNDYSEFGDAETIYSYGAGFRYLLARKFKLRMGVDIARGPDNWAYYLVFGSTWMK